MMDKVSSHFEREREKRKRVKKKETWVELYKTKSEIPNSLTDLLILIYIYIYIYIFVCKWVKIKERIS